MFIDIQGADQLRQKQDRIDAALAGIAAGDDMQLGQLIRAAVLQEAFSPVIPVNWELHVTALSGNAFGFTIRLKQQRRTQV